MAVADEITLVVVDSRVKMNWDMRLEKYRSLTLSTFSTTFDAKNEKLTAEDCYLQREGPSIIV